MRTIMLANRVNIVAVQGKFPGAGGKNLLKGGTLWKQIEEISPSRR
jgi:hypothetical protein